MSTICGKINANISKSCSIPLQGGTEDTAYIINKADVDTVTYAADGYTVEAISLVASTTAFTIDGKNNSISPVFTLADLEFDNMFDHSVTFKGFDISPAIKSQLNAAKDGKFIVIVENYFKGTAGNSSFEIFGLTTGLEFSELTRNANDEATQGAFHFILNTKTNKEPHMPNPLFVTSYADSKAVVVGLL